MGFIVIVLVLNAKQAANEQRVALEATVDRRLGKQEQTHRQLLKQKLKRLLAWLLERKNATARADLATRNAQPTSTPRSSIISTPIPSIQGVGVSLYEIRRAFEEAGFEFSPIRDNSYQYGASSYHTANGSIAEVEVSLNNSNIHRIELTVYDVHIEPQLGALNILLFFDTVFSDWRDAELAQWTADAADKLERGEVVKHRRKTSNGYAQIEMVARSTTIFVTVNAE